MIKYPHYVDVLQLSLLFILCTERIIFLIIYFEVKMGYFSCLRVVIASLLGGRGRVRLKL